MSKLCLMYIPKVEGESTDFKIVKSLEKCMCYYSGKNNIISSPGYLSRIKYVRDLLGGVDNIAVSTDDMSYYGTKYYKHFNVFRQENVRDELEKLLLRKNFSKREISKILYRNFYEKVLNKL